MITGLHKGSWQVHGRFMKFLLPIRFLLTCVALLRLEWQQLQRQSLGTPDCKLSLRASSPSTVTDNTVIRSGSNMNYATMSSWITHWVDCSNCLWLSNEKTNISCTTFAHIYGKILTTELETKTHLQTASSVESTIFVDDIRQCLTSTWSDCISKVYTQGHSI